MSLMNLNKNEMSGLRKAALEKMHQLAMDKAKGVKNGNMPIHQVKMIEEHIQTLSNAIIKIEETLFETNNRHNT